VFQVVATDSSGLSSAPILVTVPTGNCGPGLTGISASTASPTVGGLVTMTTAPLAIPDACVAGGGLTYAWSITSRPLGSGAGLTAPSSASPIFVPDVPGSYEIALTVTDSGGFSTAATTIVRAGGC